MPYAFTHEAKEKLTKMQRFTLKGAMAHLAGGEYREPETAWDAVLEELKERDVFCLSEDGKTITFRDENAAVQPVSLRELLIQYLGDGILKATGKHNGWRKPIPPEFWRHERLHIDWGDSAAGFFTDAPSEEGIVRIGMLYARRPGAQENQDDLTDIDVNVINERLLPYIALYHNILVDYFEPHFSKPANDPAPQRAVQPILRKRGRRAVVFERVKSEMLQKIQSGEWSKEDLEAKFEKTLAFEFRASRDVCRRARNTILAELKFVANSQTKGDK